MPRRKKDARTIQVQASGGVPRFEGKVFTAQVPVDIIREGDYEGLVEYLKGEFVEQFLSRFVVVNNVHYSVLDLEDESESLPGGNSGASNSGMNTNK